MKKNIYFLMIILCFLVGCSTRGEQGVLSEFQFNDLDVKYYYYRAPEDGLTDVDFNNYGHEFLTNFEIYNDYINEANFYDLVVIDFSANDYESDRKERGVEVTYSIFDENFMPFKSEILYKKGDKLPDGNIAEKDIYDNIGEIYSLSNKSWVNNKITLDFNGFGEHNPTYLKIRLKAIWLVYDESKESGNFIYHTSTSTFWSSEFVAIFKLDKGNS